MSAANHYETLGVQTSATAEDIKAGYRRSSSKAHPDKGGSDEQMAAVNRAYDVLGDAERRARYDATGSDERLTTVEQQARDLLLDAFRGALAGASANPVEAVRRALAENTSHLAMAKSQAESKVRRLEARRGKVRVAKGENLFEMLIDAELQQVNDELLVMASAEKVFAAAREQLADYACDINEEPRNGPTYGGLIDMINAMNSVAARRR